MLTNLLGRQVDSIEFREFIARFKRPPQWIRDGDELFCEIEGESIELMFTLDGSLLSIVFYGQGDHGFINPEIPHNISMNMSQDNVRQNLGTPDECGDGEVFLNEVIPPWDKYFMEGYSIHIAYKEDRSTITQLSFDAEGGKRGGFAP